MEWLDSALKLSQIGSTGLLIVAVWALATGRVVPRWLYDRETKRADAWETLYSRERAYNEAARQGSGGRSS